MVRITRNHDTFEFDGALVHGNVTLCYRYKNHTSYYLDDDFIDCANYTWFWVSWGNGEVRMGKGTFLGKSTMLALDYPDPIPVAGMMIGTGQKTMAGYWILNTGELDPPLVKPSSQSTFCFKQWERKLSFPVSGRPN